MLSKCKPFLAMVLAAALLMGMAACGGAKNNASGTGATSGSTASDSGASSSSSSSEEATPSDSSGDAAASDASSGAMSRDEFVGGPLDAFAETVTITVLQPTNATQYFHEGDTWDNHAWTRKIMDDLNIKVEIGVSVDENSYDERLNTLIVSGDVPDIFHSYNRIVMREAQNAGLLQPLDDLMNHHATRGIQDYREMFADSFAGATLDGVLYGFPDGSDNFHTPQYIWIRDDWLENTGSKPPTTVDEYIALAHTFTTGDPNNDGSVTYGIAMTQSIQEGMGALLSAYGVPGQMWGDLYYRRDGGDITCNWIQPEVKNVLQILRDLYADGVIDPEFTVKDGTALEVDIANHKVGMYDYRNWGTWYPFNIIFESDEIVSRPYPIPTVPGIDFKVGVDNNFGGKLTFMKSGHAYPEAFMKIINLFNLVCYESLDEQDFETYYNNSYHWLVPVGTWIANELYAPQIHEAIKNNSRDQLPATMRPYYDFVVNFENGSDRSGPAYGTWGQTFARGSMAIALYDYRDAGHSVQNMMGLEGFIPQASIDDGGVLGTIKNTAFTEMVIGTRSIDAFDEFVQDWLNNGGQKILDEMNGFYN